MSAEEQSQSLAADTVEEALNSAHSSREASLHKSGEPQTDESSEAPAEKRSLQDAFTDFASFGSSSEESEIDNSKLLKLCKESALIDKKFTSTDVDLLLNKIKTKGSRKLSFGQFRDQFIPEVAKKKTVAPALVADLVARSAPVARGTKADDVRLHDDDEAYTGVHAAGGPSTIDDKNTNMAGHMDRDKKSDARGVVQDDAEDPSKRRQRRRSSVVTDTSPSPSSRSRSRRQSGAEGSEGGSMSNSALAPLKHHSVSSTAEGSPLFQSFVGFASFGSSQDETQIDNSKFAKLCKECGLFDKKFTKTDGDLLFNKLKVGRKMSFDDFKNKALPVIAEKRGVPVSEIEERVADSLPVATGTQADAVKFHDDKSQYTGVYAAGGPSTIDDKNTNMAGHMDRSKSSDARGVVQESGRGRRRTSMDLSIRSGSNSESGSPSGRQRRVTLSPVDSLDGSNVAFGHITDPLERTFVVFASFGSDHDKREIDNAKFAKLCKDCRLVDKKFTMIDVDLLFNMHKTKRRIDFTTFKEKVLPSIAKKKAIDIGVLEDRIASSKPVSVATQADSVKLFDDKSQYTGVYAAGGPSTIDNKNTDMAGHMDRSKNTDARGVVQETHHEKAVRRQSMHTEFVHKESPVASALRPEQQFERHGSLERYYSGNSIKTPKHASQDEVSELQQSFIAFSSFGMSEEESEIDNVKMSKLCKECGLMDKKFTTTDVDLIFNKFKQKNRRISFTDFKEKVIPQIAARKGVSPELVEQIVSRTKPVVKATKAEAVKFHDDKSMYTGVYAAGGPTNIDDGNTNLAGLANRSKQSDARGVVVEKRRKSRRRTAATIDTGEEGDATPSLLSSIVSSSRRSRHESIAARQIQPPEAPPLLASEAVLQGEDNTKLHEAFKAFAAFPTGEATEEMGSSQLAKLVRDCSLLNNKVEMSDIDLVFTALCVRGKQHVTYESFRDGILPLVAFKRSEMVEEIAELIIVVGKPKPLDASSSSSPSPNRSLKKKSKVSGGDPAVTGELDERLYSLFRAFAGFGGSNPEELGNSQLAKLMRECDDLLDRYFTMTDVDLIFNKLKVRGKRFVPYEVFRDGIVPQMARKKGMAVEEVCEIFIATGGPKLVNATVAQDVTFTESRDIFAMAASSPTGAGPAATLDTLPLLGALSQESEPGSMLHALGAATHPTARSETPRKAQLVPGAASPKKFDHSKLTAKDATKLIEAHAQEIKDMRKLREDRELKKIQAERDLAEKLTTQRKEREEEIRQQREAALKDRMEMLRVRREERELEYLVGLRRAHKVLKSKNLADEIEARYMLQQQKEAEERDKFLQERRQVMRQQVVIDPRHVDEQKSRVETDRLERRAHLREQMKEVERSTAPASHIGESYERVQEDFMRAKHVHADDHHARMYKQMKMHEYGKLVSQLPGDPTPLRKERKRREKEGIGRDAPSALLQAPTHKAKPSMEPVKRNKTGNDYLREVLEKKPSLPPGLKLAPMAEDEEAKRRKASKKKGNDYLRELAEQQARDGYTKPAMQNFEDPSLEIYRDLTEVKRLRHKATTVETKIKVRSHLGDNSAKYLRSDSDDDEDEMRRVAAQEQAMKGELDEAEQYLDVVKTKMELLRRVEEIKKKKERAVKNGKLAPHEHASLNNSM